MIEGEEVARKKERRSQLLVKGIFVVGCLRVPNVDRWRVV